MPNIVVVGAGVSGLTSAYVLSQQSGNKVTVIAKHMPGDYDIEYASPVAGANVMPMATAATSRWERETWPVLKKLCAEVPEAGIHFQKSRIYTRQKDVNNIKEGEKFDAVFAENPWYGSMFDDFRALRADELPAGMARGYEFTSVCINVMLYMPWLVGQCRRNGVVFRRASLQHLLDAARFVEGGLRPDIIVNATGLGARKLGGVMDANMTPVRGQLVIVRNEAPDGMWGVSGTDDGAEEMCYGMMRAVGGGTILGGTYMKGNWESQPDPNIASRIMRRACDLLPELTGGKGPEALDIIRHGVGLRPHREGGVRVEKEKIDGTWVVHNYGHSSWGYQGSWGCAAGVQELVNEILSRGKL